MENKPAQTIEPTLQESEAQVTPAQPVEVTETPEQTAEKVEVTTSSADTLAKMDAEKPGFGLKFRKGLMKAAALVGIGGALAGGTALNNNETARETPAPDVGTSEGLTAKDPSQDILVNPNIPDVLKNEAKDPSLDINANPNLPEELRVIPPVSAPEAGVNATAGESDPSVYATPITPEAATSIPTFPAEGEGGAQVYTIPTPGSSNEKPELSAPVAPESTYNGQDLAPPTNPEK